ATLEIASNDADENPFRLALSGIGVDPEIVVEEPAGADLADGGSRGFGSVLVGASVTKTLTIRNTGTTDLTDLALSKAGSQAGDFVLGELAAGTVAPGQSATFDVTFAPTLLGTRGAVVRIASNDGNENPFDIEVEGTGLAPEVVVEGPDGAGLTDNAGTVNLGGAVIGNQGAAQTFVIRNAGNSQLTGLQVSATGAGSADFVIGGPGAASLAPGASTNFTVTFSPLAAGNKAAVIKVVSNDADENPFDVNVSAAAYPKEPVFPTQVLSRWATLGQPVALAPIVTGSDPKVYQWYKGTAKVAGAAGSGPILNLTKATAADAAIFSVRVSNAFVTVPVQSPNAYLGVVTRGPASASVNAGATLNLPCTAVVPKGATLGYEWLRENLPLTDGGRVSGATMKALKITGLLPEEAGNYTCRVTMTTPGGAIVGNNGDIAVVVVQKPFVEAFTLEDAYVAQSIQFVIPAQNNPASFTVTGLPPGVVVSKAGVISGKPKAAKVVKGAVVPYELKVTAINSAGKSNVFPVTWKILPLNPGAMGTFNGIVDRHDTLNGGLGGSIRLVATSSGGFTGTLKLGGLSHALTGVLTTPPGGGNPTGSLTLVRKAPLTNLTVHWGIDLVTGELTGEVDDANSEPASMKAWRAPWSSTMKATAYAYAHTAALTPDTGMPDNVAIYPQGEGYALLTVTSTGTATWGGKLADGSVITGGTTVGPNGEVALQTMFYSNTGSVQGWSVIDASGNLDSDGVIDWGKATQPTKSTTRSYKNGIPLHELVLTGGRYVKPTGIVLGLPAQPANAKVHFVSGGLEEQLTQVFTVTDKNAVLMPKAGDENPAAVKVTLAAATGLISGSFTLGDLDPLDATEPVAVLKRTASFNGVLVPRLGRGAGHFQLQRLPEAVGETLAKTVILSGSVEFGPAMTP
ncbi:MAG TPA: choice-of-anchor D domain-containing protein, partial [Prosthecobacter sp.]|nr:choice-of-anchor D domain-containing protein [Prosthecobacter sp.]